MAGMVDVERELVPKLLEVISLILIKEENSRSKKNSSKTIHDAYSLNTLCRQQNQFLLGKQFYSEINKCILSHHFEDAAKLLWVVAEDRGCFDMFLFKGFMIILDNLIPNDVNEIVKKISPSAKRLMYANRYEVQLDCLIHAFKNNIEDLQNSSKTLDKSGKGSFIPIPLLQNIYSAYCALLNYLKWVKICQDDTLSADCKDIAMNVINSLMKFIYQPGNWDIFVLKIIEMLEYYEEYDELEEILKKYVECNPEHVNSYIYICVHLHKHKADSEAFVHYAEILTELCPSDERVLWLVQTWRTNGENFVRRLKILFYFLDYPTNKRNVEGWRMLSSHLHEATLGEQSDVVDIVQSFWSTRCNSWNYVHFLPSNIHAEDESYELTSHKVHVLTILNPSHKYIQEAELRFPEMRTHKSINDGVLDYENSKTLYLFDR